MTILSAEGFCDAECTECETRIGTQEAMEDACYEPFNGAIVECPNEDCDAEYSIDLGFRINKI